MNDALKVIELRGGGCVGGGRTMVHAEHVPDVLLLPVDLRTPCSEPFQACMRIDRHPLAQLLHLSVAVDFLNSGVTALDVLQRRALDQVVGFSLAGA